jgi:pteridine reductase
MFPSYQGEWKIEMSPQTDGLKGKTALVTGALRRIGREIALALADAGVNVVAHCRRSAGEAEELREELISRGVKAWLVEADFEDAGETQRLFPTALRSAGPIDILVNSASTFLPDTVRDMGFAGLMRHIQVNAWAPFSLSREFALQTGNGKIINLLDSRIVGFDWSHVSYILSKRVFAALTEMMAVEYAPGITVNGIAPGLILPPPGKDQRYLEDLAGAVPLKRHGGTGDITRTVLYFRESDFVTGPVVFVDGGRHLMEQNHGPDHHK